MRWTLTILFAARAFACQTVDGDRIVARDLAAANPNFASLDPGLPVAATPIPGAVRVMHAAELIRFAREHGVELPVPTAEVCFERYSEPLTAEKLLPVLRDALRLDGAAIEIVDFIHAAVPRGPLEFSLNGLDASGFWRGRVRYAPACSIPIWAKVRVTVDRTWIEATEPIAAGKVIEANQIAERTGPRFPFGTMPADALDLVAGRAALRSIRSGEAIFENMLLNPHEVERGDTVSVEVTSGAAKLKFDAKAESSGHTGEPILLRNPENGRYFQARIQGKDKAEIIK